MVMRTPKMIQKQRKLRPLLLLKLTESTIWLLVQHEFFSSEHISLKKTMIAPSKRKLIGFAILRQWWDYACERTTTQRKVGVSNKKSNDSLKWLLSRERFSRKMQKNGIRMLSKTWEAWSKKGYLDWWMLWDLWSLTVFNARSWHEQWIPEYQI